MGRTVSRDWPKERDLVVAMLAMAEKVANASCCPRAKHGCVITDTNFQVISYGYNGPPKRLPNECARPTEAGNCGCVHAEANAVAKAGRIDEPKFAFITGHPCEYCASLLLNSNVVAVTYSAGAHRAGLTAGVDRLSKAMIPHGRPFERRSTYIRTHQREIWETMMRISKGLQP